MPISKEQRSNLKKFRRSDNTAYLLQEVDMNFIELDKAIRSNDEKLFFSIYNKLVERGLIHDNKHREKLRLESMEKAIGRQLTKPQPINTEAEKNSIPLATKAPEKAPTAKVIESVKPQKKQKANKVRYNLLIDEDILEQLKHEAIATDRSVSSLIRISVIAYLNQRGNRNE